MFTRSDDEIIKAFYQLQSRVDVANLLEIKDKSLRYYLYSIRPKNMYSIFKIKKKNGDFREICSPSRELKNIQRKLKYILELVYKPKICAYGFIKNKNIIQNANNHIKKSVILNIDLQDFFAQVNFGRIRGMLMAEPYSLGEEAATVISQIACYNGYLPQGAPSSPILSNMICVPLDNALIKFSKRNKIIYTRYADDISFSTFRSSFNSNVVSDFQKRIVVGTELYDVIEKNGFMVNPQKIHLKYKNNRQEVTGIVVNRFPNVKREYIRNLRAILHNCETIGIYESAQRYIDSGFCHNKKIISQSQNPKCKDFIMEWFSQVIKGKIDYIKQVKGGNSMTFLALAKKANYIFKQDLFDISLLTNLNDMIRKNVFILESEISGEDFYQGSGFYLNNIGLITSYHVTENSLKFSVFTEESYNHKRDVAIIRKDLNEVSSDSDIDYAVYNVTIPDTIPMKCGDSTKLKIGDNIIIAGYPNYSRGDSVTIQSCHIIGIGHLFGSLFYKVSGRVIHGSSGGIVFNNSNEVIGIIEGGIASTKEDDSNDNQGFIPIHLVLESLNNMIN